MTRFLIPWNLRPQNVICIWPGADIHVQKQEKFCRKFEMKAILLRLATNNQCDKWIYNTTKICLQWLSALGLGLIYGYEIMKNLYKFQAKCDSSEKDNRWSEWRKDFVIDTILPGRLSALTTWIIYIHERLSITTKKGYLSLARGYTLQILDNLKIWP